MCSSCVFFHWHKAMNTVYLCPRRSMSHQNNVLLANQKEEKTKKGGILFSGVLADNVSS